MFPVFHTPVSLVEVCAAPSSFFQVTVVPTATVRLTGENAIPAIVTVFGGGGVGDGPVPYDPVEFELSELHPATIRQSAKRNDRMVDLH
jgi:hypothetical protein